jgi:hypothetical protein
MEKLNREFDERRIEMAKVNTIDNVMERINQKRSFLSWFSLPKLRVAIVSMSILILAVVIFATNANNPTTPPALSEFQTKKLVETSYMSATIISNVVTDSITPLAYTTLLAIDNEETEFEKNIDEFNYYFNMLKAFIDDDSFIDNAIIEELQDSEYDYEISYFVDNKEYVFLLVVNEDNTISGQLTIGTKTMNIEGKIKDEVNEYNMEIVARSNQDYIKIEYKTETDDETVREYLIQEYINGVETEKEVKIEIEGDEVKVEMQEGENEYLLEQYLRNGFTTYYLEYEVNGLEGEAYITESLDANGKTIYSYHIEEDGREKDIELEDPDEKDDDDEDEEDDEEDEEIEDEEQEDQEQEEDEEEPEDEEDEDLSFIL